jgi:hypothetical protein
LAVSKTARREEWCEARWVTCSRGEVTVGAFIFGQEEKRVVGGRTESVAVRTREGAGARGRESMGGERWEHEEECPNSERPDSPSRAW